jgi:hypothetical protein
MIMGLQHRPGDPPPGRPTGVSLSLTPRRPDGSIEVAVLMCGGCR